MNKVIHLDQMTWKRKDRLILEAVNWTVTRGQHWAILGLNGSGKTSLLQIVTGYIWPSKGRVEILGQPFGQTDLRALRKRIGWVSVSLADRFAADQSADTALEIVLSGKYASIGLWDEIDANDVEAAVQLMERLGCVNVADSPFAWLSQGERQRVLIARALFARPELLILDEPCTGLDMLAREQLLGLIESLASDPSGPTLLYVTHHTEEIVPSITHALILDGGRVVCSAPKQDALVSQILSSAFHVPIEAREVDGRTWVTVVSTTGDIGQGV